MQPASWVPPVGWMALILWLSGERFSAEATGAVLTPVLHWLMPWASGVLAAVIHGGLRKLAHLTLSAVLALLWYRAFARGRGLPAATATPLAFAIAATWAGVDEGHQAVTLSRSGNVGDVAIDWAGAAIALVARRGWGGLDHRRGPRRPPSSIPQDRCAGKAGARSGDYSDAGLV